MKFLYKESEFKKIYVFFLVVDGRGWGGRGGRLEG